MEFDDILTTELEALALHYKRDREVAMSARDVAVSGSAKVHLNAEVDALYLKIERVETEINYRGSFSPSAATKVKN